MTRFSNILAVVLAAAVLLLAARGAAAHPGVSHEHETPALIESAWQAAGRYLSLGFLHIVPKGLDHVLFVLGLFLAGGRFKTLILQLTSFTLAHSVTLAFATLGWVSVSPSIVEPLIALSIAYVALENVIFGAGGNDRLAIVFGFGLLHGLGFADALSEAGLPPGRFLLSLLTFNVGVELGQLAVIAVAAMICRRWMDKPWYRGRLELPVSALIAVFGCFWLIERTLL